MLCNVFIQFFFNLYAIVTLWFGPNFCKSDVHKWDYAGWSHKTSYWPVKYKFISLSNLQKKFFCVCFHLVFKNYIIFSRLYTSILKFELYKVFIIQIFNSLLSALKSLQFSIRCLIKKNVIVFSNFFWFYLKVLRFNFKLKGRFRSYFFGLVKSPFSHFKICDNFLWIYL